jgi:hypothetical protein
LVSPGSARPAHGFLFASALQFDGIAQFNVTKTRTRPGGPDAHGHQAARFLGSRHRQQHRLLKSFGVRDHVIRREHHHGGGVIAHGHPSRAQSERRGSVAFRRFGHDILWRQFLEQGAHTFLLVGVGEHENAFGRNPVSHPGQRLLEKRVFGNEAQQLLWKSSPAQRPKTFAAAARENQCINMVAHADGKNSGSPSGRFPFIFSETRSIG